MSWGTEFTTEVYISRQHYNSVACVKEAIEHNESIIADIKNRLIALASAHPRELAPADYQDDIAGWVVDQVTQATDDLAEAVHDNTLLGQLIGNFENAKAV